MAATEPITSSEVTFERLKDMGISISVPENSLNSQEEPSGLHIHPCLSGPFELPDDYQSASPAYLVNPSNKTDLQKDITIRIQHYVNLLSQEDCEDMAFLSASSTPEYRESSPGPVYTFNKIPGAKGVFRPGDQVGEIALRHFGILKAGKRKREEAASHSTQLQKKHRGIFINK